MLGRLCAWLWWSKSRQYPRIQSVVVGAATREEGEASHVCFANAPFTVQLQLWRLRRRVGLVMVFMMWVCPLVDGQHGAPAASASPSIISTKNKAPFFTLPSSPLHTHHTGLARKAHIEETQEPRVALSPSRSHGRRQRYVCLPSPSSPLPRSSSIIIIIDRGQARLRVVKELWGTCTQLVRSLRV